MSRTTQVTETPEQVAAFRAYNDMGPNRSLTALADQIGVSRVSLSKWAKKWKWEQRLSLVQDKIAEQVVKEIGFPIAKGVAAYLTGVDQVLADWFESYRIGATGLQIKTPKDLKDLVEVRVRLGAIATSKDPNEQQAQDDLSTLSRFLNESDGKEVLSLLQDALRSSVATTVPQFSEAELIDETEEEREWREFKESLPPDKRARFEEKFEDD